jgi:hypothetical protein
MKLCERTAGRCPEPVLVKQVEMFEIETADIPGRSSTSFSDLNADRCGICTPVAKQIKTALVISSKKYAKKSVFGCVSDKL